MKNIIKNFIVMPILAIGLVAGSFAVFTQTVDAAQSLESSHPTLRAANHSDCPTCINWNAEGATFATGDAQDRPIIALGIAYKNNSSSTAQDVTVRLTPTSGNGGTTYFTGRVWADGFGQEVGSASVEIPAGQDIEFTGDLFWYQNGNSPINLSASSNQLASGYTLGNVPAGHSGGLVAHFEITGGTPDPDPEPYPLDVDTQDAELVTTSSARLTGETNGHGTSVEVWFEYATNQGYLSTYGNGNLGAQTTSPYTQNSYNGWLPYQRNITGLQSGTTYYYQLCGDNGDVVECGGIESFTTLGSSQPTDVCPNIPGNQSNVPNGYYLENGECLEVVIGNDNIQIDTLSALDEDEDSALLRGRVDEEEDGNVSAWFEWDDSSSVVSNGNGTYLSVSGTHDEGDTFSRTLTGLQEDETYYYRACGEDQNGNTDCGPVESFSTDSENNNEDEPDVETENPSNVDEDSARLNGSYDMNDFNDGDVFFAWSDDEDDLDDIEDEDRITDVDNYANVEIIEYNADGSDNNVRETITGLRDNTRYYYRLCVLYEDADGDDVIECGNVEDFVTRDDFEPRESTDRPIPGACAATNIGVASATLAARVDGNGGTTSSYFEYGRTQSFGLRSTISTTGSNTNIVAKFISGLSANTTYYCRIVAENSDGTSYGDVGTFRTGTLNVITPTPTTPVTIVSGGSGSPIFLEIDDDQEMAARGQVLQYDVRWENISGRDLEDVVLNVRLPKSVRFSSSTDGRYNRRDHNVTVNIGSLEAGEEDEMVIFGVVRGGTEGDQLVAEATIAFEDPQGETRGLLATIEYDVDTYTNGANGLLAGLFGVGFLPGIIGLLLAILLILIIVLVARRLTEPRRTEYRG